MGFLQHRAYFTLADANSPEVIKKLKELLRNELRRIYPEKNIAVGEKLIKFSRGTFGLYGYLSFLDLIHLGEIRIDKSNRLVSMVYVISFSRFVIFVVVATLLVIGTMITQNLPLSHILIGLLVFFAWATVMVTIAMFKFDALIQRCISKAGARILA